MNFPIDANLPRRLIRVFQERGHLIAALTESRFVELTREHVIVHT
jgi:hypothetical protein